MHWKLLYIILDLEIDNTTLDIKYELTLTVLRLFHREKNDFYFKKGLQNSICAATHEITFLVILSIWYVSVVCFPSSWWQRCLNKFCAWVVLVSYFPFKTNSQQCIALECTYCAKCILCAKADHCAMLPCAFLSTHFKWVSQIFSFFSVAAPSGSELEEGCLLYLILGWIL